MFAYELHQARSAEFRRRAEEWRLVQEAKAGRAARRRARTQARRAQPHTAVRVDAEGASSPDRAGTSRVGSADRSGAGPLGVHRAPRPRGAA